MTAGVDESMFGWSEWFLGAAHREPDLEVLHVPPEQGSARDVPPLLFIHGAYTGAWCWHEHFLGWFARHGFDAYAVSLRGHGNSHGADALHQAGLRDYVDDVRRVVADMPTPPVLVGHSMGGMVIQKYLERYSAPATVLMATVPPAGLGPSMTRLMASDPILFSQIAMVQAGARDLVDTANAGRAVFSDDLDPELRDIYGARMQPESQRALMDMTFADLPRPWRMHLPPMLVLGAARDALFSANETRRTARAYGAEHRVYAGMAHAMMLEKGWADVARGIRDWVRTQARALAA